MNILFIFNGDNCIFACAPLLRNCILKSANIVLVGDDKNAVVMAANDGDQCLLAMKSYSMFESA